MADLAWLEDLPIADWLLPGGCLDLDQCPPCWERNAHLERYGFACAALKGSRVLDYGCGIGYGTEMLVAAGNVVTGCDSSASALAVAQERRGHLAPLLLPYQVTEAARFDAAVAFEVLEHLENPEVFLAMMAMRARHLIISTPIVPTVANNPWHRHDFTFVEFRKMIERRFTIRCEWFQMRPWRIEPCYAVIHGESRK